MSSSGTPSSQPRGRTTSVRPNFGELPSRIPKAGRRAGRSGSADGGAAATRAGSTGTKRVNSAGRRRSDGAASKLRRPGSWSGQPTGAGRGANVEASSVPQPQPQPRLRRHPSRRQSKLLKEARAAGDAPSQMPAPKPPVATSSRPPSTSSGTRRSPEVGSAEAANEAPPRAPSHPRRRSGSRVAMTR